VFALLLLILAIFAPRVVIVVLALFTTFLERAYDGLLLPVLGFIFLPLTTLAFAWAVNASGGVRGLFWLVVIVVAVLIDIGSWGWHVRRR
jgi:hypothetical protein